MKKKGHRPALRGGTGPHVPPLTVRPWEGGLLSAYHQTVSQLHLYAIGRETVFLTNDGIDRVTRVKVVHQEFRRISAFSANLRRCLDVSKCLKICEKREPEILAHFNTKLSI